MNYAIKNNSIELNSGKKVTFEYPIHQVVETEDALVISLDVPTNRKLNENVYGIAHDGRLLWQIKPVHHPIPSSWYVAIEKVGKIVRAFNYDGMVYDLQPSTGEVVSSYFGK